MTSVRTSSVGGKENELAKLKRDLDEALKSLPRFKTKTLDAAYTEPLYLGFDHRPSGVLLLSCIDARDQEGPEEVLSGGFTHWTWEGGKARIRINSIDGLSPDEPTKTFRFTFLVVG